MSMYFLSSYLCSQFFHIGVNLIQDVEALLEQSVLGAHEGQHLQKTRRDNDGSKSTVLLILLTPQRHMHIFDTHMYKKQYNNVKI